jgi:hypothetical protein
MCNNQLKRTKNRGQKEGKLHPSKLSPKKCLQKNKKQQNPPQLSPSIQSRLVGSAGLMLPPAKKVLLWIRSLGAMTLAKTTRLVLASHALPWWWSQAINTEWMGSPPPKDRHTSLPKVKGRREGVEDDVEEGTSDGVPKCECSHQQFRWHCWRRMPPQSFR